MALQALDGLYKKAFDACSKELKATAPPFVGLCQGQKVCDLPPETKEKIMTFRNWIKNVKEPCVVAIIEEYMAKCREKDRLCREKKRSSGKAETEHEKYVRLHGMSRRSYEINKKLNDSFPNGVPESIPKYPFTTDEVENEADVDLQFKRNLFIKHILEKYPDTPIGKFLATKRVSCQNIEKTRKREGEHCPEAEGYAEVRKRRRIEYEEVFRERVQKRNERNRERVEWKISEVKRSAFARNKVFELSDAEIGELVVEPCHYCEDHSCLHGVDCVVPVKGYVLDNVVPCCTLCNRMKGALTGEIFTKLCHAITRVQEGNDMVAYSNALGERRSSRFWTYRKDAARFGRVFELSDEQFDHMTSQKCTYCHYNRTAVGIDRVDSNKGYIPENCVGCCHWCNRVKREYPLDVFLNQCHKVAELYDYM